MANTLINETWTTAQLSDAFVSADPDVASVNAHFDHNRALPADQTVTLSAAASKLTLAGGKSRFTLQTLPADDFPLVNEAVDFGPAFSVPQKTLRTLVNQVHFAMAVHDIRYYLNGILFIAEGRMLTLVATDGHRLALVTTKRDGAATQTDEVRAILPKKTLGELARLLTEGDEDIRYERGENHLFFDVGGRLLISRMIDGQFPAYERVIPKANDKHIEFERDRLTNAVKRVALLSNERSRAVKFEIAKGKVDVTSSSSEFGEAREQLAVDYSGPTLAISFNAQYVLDFLNVVETDSVTLSVKDEVSQAVMKPVGAQGYDYTYVIMPMRI